jgi:hypothetical protein
MLKQIKEPIWRLTNRIPDPKQPSMKEINAMTRKARHDMAKKT